MAKIVRALSIQQPFAEEIMAKEKLAEYRSWPTKIRGRVYIYASKKPGAKERWKKSGRAFGTLPVGVLVGTVEIVGCRERTHDYAWILARPRRLKRKLRPRNQPQPAWFYPF